MTFEEACEVLAGWITRSQGREIDLTSGGKLSFRFIADWKAHGELNLTADGTATGFINQKDHITELRCKIHRK